MERVHHNDLVVFARSVLVDPVGVQHAQVGTNTTSTLLCNAAQIPCKLKLIDALVLGLPVNNTLPVGPFAAAATNGNAVNHIALQQTCEQACQKAPQISNLFGLVTKFMSFVCTCWAAHSLHLFALAIFPRPACNVMPSVEAFHLLIT